MSVVRQSNLTQVTPHGGYYNEGTERKNKSPFRAATHGYFLPSNTAQQSLRNAPVPGVERRYAVGQAPQER
jgi:hypothetical protein